MSEYQRYEDQGSEYQAKATKEQYKVNQAKMIEKLKGIADKNGFSHNHPEVQKSIARYIDPDDGTQRDNLAASNAVTSASEEPSQDWSDTHGEWWYAQDRNDQPTGDFAQDVSPQFDGGEGSGAN